MRLERFVLLGHSFGAYIACAYTLQYPERVRHLILVDPWGFAQPPNEQEVRDKFKQTSWFWRAVGKLKPFTVVRAAGPWGEDHVCMLWGLGVSAPPSHSLCVCCGALG